jgi:hypothetical protein
MMIDFILLLTVIVLKVVAPLEELAVCKHSSLFCRSVNDEERKSFKTFTQDHKAQLSYEEITTVSDSYLSSSYS